MFKTEELISDLEDLVAIGEKRRELDRTYFFDTEARLKRDWERPLRTLASENFDRLDNSLLFTCLLCDLVSLINKKDEKYREENEDIIIAIQKTIVPVLDTVISNKKEIYEIYPNIKKEFKRNTDSLRDFTSGMSHNKKVRIRTEKGFI